MKNQESIKFQENQKKRHKNWNIPKKPYKKIKKQETNEKFKKSMFYKNYCRHIHIGFIF